MDDLETEAYQLLLEPSAPRDSRPAPKMKPNTRFLRHIVREANSHNSALLAKETADSQRRLKRLMRSESGADNSREDDAEDDRNDKKDADRQRHRHSRHTSHRHERADDNRDKDRRKADNERNRSHRHKSGRDGERDKRDNRDAEEGEQRRSRWSRHSSHSKSPDRRDGHRSSRHRRRSRSPERDEGRLSRHHHRERSPLHKSRQRDEERISTSRKADRDRDRDKRRDGRGTATSKRSISSDRSRSQSLSRSAAGSDSDSDPLDEFVGPRLASDSPAAGGSRVRARGRGLFSRLMAGTAGSSMDRHFAADYDPSEDVEMQQQGPTLANNREEDGGGTVEDARAEMQRDRKQLLRSGAERLKAAGFTDREIAIWARGGRREVEDIPWAKKGEAREWDRGKVPGDDGPAKPLWAR